MQAGDRDGTATPDAYHFGRLWLAVAGTAPPLLAFQLARCMAAVMNAAVFTNEPRPIAAIGRETRTLYHVIVDRFAQSPTLPPEPHGRAPQLLKLTDRMERAPGFDAPRGIGARESYRLIRFQRADIRTAAVYVFGDVFGDVADGRTLGRVDNFKPDTMLLGPGLIREVRKPQGGKHAPNREVMSARAPDEHMPMGRAVVMGLGDTESVNQDRHAL